MSEETMLFIAMMTPVLLVCGVLALWRLRRWSAARAKAEQRAALALKEIERTSKELRRRAPTP